MRPYARAAAVPAEVRSRIVACSNSANEPIICVIMWHAGVVVSMFSVIDQSGARLSDPLHDGHRQLGICRLSESAMG
jgi:hypothetical protein